MTLSRALAVALLLGVPALVPACKKTPDDAPTSAASASASVAPSAAPAGSEEGREDADVRPVYPPLKGPAHPLAKKLCGALYGVSAARRATCCNAAPQAGIEGECERNVTGALGFDAIDLAESDIDACAAAVAKTSDGCDWVTPGAQLPSLPPECAGIVKGKLARGSRCRSSLECTGNLRCHGVGPTTVGVCGPAKAQGVCGAAADVLATYTRDEELDKRHPECTELCGRRKCEAFAKAGADCRFDGACGPGNHCEKGKCAPGDAGKVGEACVNGACVRGARCVKGTCAAPRKEGDACDEDAQCRGGCVKPAGAAQGTCTKECSRVVALPPPGTKPTLRRK